MSLFLRVVYYSDRYTFAFLIVMYMNSQVMGNYVSLSNKEKQTISYYEDSAQKWVHAHGPDSKPSFWSDELEHFHTLLPQGKILEIGCGAGKEASYFIDKGYEYTGIDPAPSLIENVQKRFKRGTFLVKSVYDIDYKQEFDGFWCSAVFLHIPKENIETALKKIHRSLVPGAVGFISLACGSGEYLDKETGRFFFLYEEKEFAHLLQKSGFTIERSLLKKKETGRWWLRSWLTFFVRVDNVSRNS